MSDRLQFTPRTDWTYSARLVCGAVTRYEQPPSMTIVRMLTCPEHGYLEMIEESWWPATPEGVAVLPKKGGGAEDNSPR